MKHRITLLLAGLLILGALPLFAASDALENLLDVGRLPYLKSSRSIQISSTDPNGQNADFRPIEPGKTLTLADIQGAGTVAHIWVTIASPEPQFLRKLVFRMYWDGEKTPSVECPVGDFFGVGFGEYVPHSSLLMGMTSGGYYCYFPMPFAKGARIEVANEGTKRCDAFYYHIDYQSVDKLPSDVGYFHAQFRRENPTTPNKDYTILEATGRGHFIGTVLSMQGIGAPGLGFLEGNESVRVDGESKPSWVGTGTEDYFISGWYFNRGTFSAPYHALTIKDDPGGKISAYRLHVLDAIPFEKSIKVSIEHGHANTANSDYSSVAYWYQTEPHADNYKMPSVEKRLVAGPEVTPGGGGGYKVGGAVEGEALIATAKANFGEFSEQGMGSFGGHWSNGSQLFYTPSKPGAKLSLTVPVEKAGSYLIGGYFTKAPDYGIFMLSVDGKPLGALVDAYDSAVVPTPLVNFGVARLKAGKVPFDIDLVGKNPASTNYFFGLDALILQRIGD